MKTRIHWFSLATWAALVILISWSIVHVRGREFVIAESIQDVRAPHRIVLGWTSDPTTTASVTWRTLASTGKALGQIVPMSADPTFAKDALTLTGLTTELKLHTGETVFHHSLDFTGLAADTVYCYRVGDGEIWSEWNTLRTAARGPAPFSFVYLGDAQNDIFSLWSRTARAAYRRAPDARFFLYAGDVVAEGYDDRLWGEWSSALGFISREIPTIATPGNHDLHRPPENNPNPDMVGEVPTIWRAHFALPLNGPVGFPSLEEAAYYLDYQGVRIISLDANLYANGDYDPTQRETTAQAQTQWLEETLRTSNQLWTIVMFHQPMYSIGKDRDNERLRAVLQPIFDKYGVDLVLQGHDHRYGRTPKLRDHAPVAPDQPGTIYAVSVSGSKMYPRNPKFESLMAVMRPNTQMYQVIHVEGGRLVYEAFAVSGERIDAFELRKESKEAPSVYLAMTEETEAPAR